MWSMFAFAVLLCAVIMYLPGFLQLKSLGCGTATSLSFAPVLSLVELVLVGLAFGMCGIPVSGLVVALIPFALAVLLLVLRVVRGAGAIAKPGLGDESADFAVPSKWLALYVAAGTVIAALFFVVPLEGPDSYVQLYDNAFHINLVKTFSDISRYSIVQATLSPSLPLAPLSDITFYPAAWHVVAALVSNVVDASPAMAENAVNFVFAAWVYPLSALYFLSVVFKDDSRIIPFGSIVVLAFAAFPWGFLAVGPLYSNFAAFAVVPLIVASFMMIVYARGVKMKVTFVLFFVVSTVCAVSSQPNSVFTAAVILAPFCVVNFYSFARRRFSKRRAAVLSAVLVAVAVLLWIALWRSSAFAGVVGYPYYPYNSPVQVAIDYLDWGFRNAAAQPLLTLFIALGVLYAISAKRYRWLLVSYVFFGVAYVVGGGIASEGWGSLLTGFWYNDVDRVAACAVLSALPVAAIGTYTLCCAAKRLISAVAGNGRSSTVAVAAAMMLAFLLFMPNFRFAGNGDVVTGMGERLDRLSEASAQLKCYTPDEEAFVDKCVSVAGDDLVINVSLDGSVFAYAENGLNVLFKHYTISASGYKDPFLLHLSELATNETVQQAVESTGVKYVLMLDADPTANFSVFDQYYDENNWRGVLGINENTPGFDLVLSEDDMRLYKIDNEYTAAAKLGQRQ